MNKKYIIGSGLLIVLILTIGIVFLLDKNKNKEIINLATSLPEPTLIPTISPSPTATLSAKIQISKPKTMANGLILEDKVVGTGVEAVSGRKITVNYTGALTDGTVFDSNVDPKFSHVEPFSFSLGAGEVIKGWDEGFAGMKVGGKRKLTIPPELGYGAYGAGSAIPPNATLVFDVELLAVE